MQLQSDMRGILTGVFNYRPDAYVTFWPLMMSLPVMTDIAQIWHPHGRLRSAASWIQSSMQSLPFIGSLPSLKISLCVLQSKLIMFLDFQGAICD